ncbi:MAG TPA: efflux RND transporter periplasmic adaptor subunit, partial [Agriterribacter sp.]|nr:efflux RND transporter periplasmic adaptor subunit [Agriterribacter sp.]
MKQLIKLAGIALLMTACNNSQPATPNVSGTAIDTVPVFILHDTSVHKSIELPAELLPYEQAALFARVQGYIKEIRVDIGDKIKRGQTLALIEAPELKSRSAEFQSSLEAAKARYMSSADVYQRLYNASRAKTAGIVAPVDLERSRNQLLADSASYESARKLAQSYNEIAGYVALQAPFDGVVTARSADRGALVGNNQVILTVQNNRTLRLRVAVPELYVASNYAQKEVMFSVDAYPEKLFTATPTRKSGSINPSTRTELWEFAFNNKNDELKAGAFAYVKLNLQRTGNSFVLPPSAITTNQERKFI